MTDPLNLADAITDLDTVNTTPDTLDDNALAAHVAAWEPAHERVLSTHMPALIAAAKQRQQTAKKIRVATLEHIAQRLARENLPMAAKHVEAMALAEKGPVL